MQVTPTRLPEVLLIEPSAIADARGFFMESWNQRVFDEAVGTAVRFVQDNHSQSPRGVLRGLHYQLKHPQGKLVRVVSGRVFDVAVDLRRSSPRLGRWVGVELSAENCRQMWVPPGFAHGLLVLSERADVLYKVSEYHHPEDDHSLAWDDPHVAVQWPLDELGSAPTLSDRDRSAAHWDTAPLY
jgi:dTDP-4-dehydrorhamnose 3,5-epimerase